MKKLAALFLVTLGAAFAADSKVMNRSPEEQRSVNQHVFAILDQNGAVEGRKYPFDQIFSSDSEQKIVALREELRRLGYVADDVDRHEKDGVVTYSIDAYQHMEFRRSVLERDSLAMLSLAKKHGVFYDGWGAEIGGKEESNSERSDSP